MIDKIADFELDKVTTIELPYPHGFLVWKGKQTALINKEPLPHDCPIAIVSDGEFFGLAMMSESVPLTEDYLENKFSAHRLKAYELPDDDSVVQNIVTFEPITETVPARIDKGYLVLDELPEVTETGMELLSKAKDLPNIITLHRGAISVTEKGEVLGDIDDTLLNMLNLNYDIELKRAEHTAESSTLSLYDITLTRTPNMRFKFIEPPNFRFAESSDDMISCGNCAYFKNGLCEQFGVTVEDYNLCDSFVPEHTGLAVMLPLRIQDAQRLILTEKDVPMGSELIPPEEMHVTMYYEPMVDVKRLIELPQIIEIITRDNISPVAELQGIGKFENVGRDGSRDAIKIGVDSPQLKMMHTWLVSYLGLIPEEVRFSPHITLAYVPAGSALPNVNFNRDSVVLPKMNLHAGGGQVFSAPFIDGMEIEEESELVTMQQGGKQMPYEIVEQNDQYCVRKIGETETMECYDNEGAAQDYLVALEIATQDESKQENKDGKKEGRRLQNKILTQLGKLYEQLGEILVWAKREDETRKLAFGIKETDEGPLFWTISSNAFEDRDGEIISTQALEEYVIRNMENKNKGYFNFWHISGSDFAEKTWQGVMGRMLVESGPFLKNKKGRAAYKFFKKYTKDHPVFAPEGWGASIEFVYLPEQRPTGVYKWLYITRTSVLPLSKAANINTLGGIKMALSAQQRELGKQVFGEELFGDIEEMAEERTKELEKTTRFKETDEEVTDEVEEEVAEETVENEVVEEEAVEQPENQEEEVVEQTDEVEEEAAEEEVVEDNETEESTNETDETPVEISPDDVITEVAEKVVGMLKDALADDLAVVNSLPGQIETLQNRMDAYEQKARTEEALKPVSAYLFGGLKRASVREDESNSAVVSKEDVEKSRPEEADPNAITENDVKTGKVFFKSSK